MMKSARLTREPATGRRTCGLLGRRYSAQLRLGPARYCRSLSRLGGRLGRRLAHPRSEEGRHPMGSPAQRMRGSATVNTRSLSATAPQTARSSAPRGGPA